MGAWGLEGGSRDGGRGLEGSDRGLDDSGGLGFARASPTPPSYQVPRVPSSFSSTSCPSTNSAPGPLISPPTPSQPVQPYPTLTKRPPGSKQLLVGFMSIYNFYAWPTSVRPRVAQVLVLPPYQGAGIGKALIRAAYDLARERGAHDLTVRGWGPGGCVGLRIGVRVHE